MKFIILALILASCSSTPSKKTQSFIIGSQSVELPSEHFSELSQMFMNEFLYIQKIEPVEFQVELNKALRSFSVVNFQKDNCSQGQVACAFKSHPGTIFINQNFFQLSKQEQFTSILHEARHLETENFEHVKCAKHPEWGYECDENLNSSYGLEYKYLLHKYINTKDEQSAQLIKKIFSRINKI